MGMECVFKSQNMQNDGLRLKNMSNCHSLEVAGRGSET